MAVVDILIPTYRRPAELAVLLTSLYYQTFQEYRVIISDQTNQRQAHICNVPIVQTITALHRNQNHQLTIYHNRPRRG